MSQHQAKNKRKMQRNITESMDVTNPNDLVEYITGVFKNYPGWRYASISPANTEVPPTVVIYLHKTVPMLVNGSYHAIEEPIYIKTIAVNSIEFPGVVISRNGDVCVGNPFNSTVKNPEIKKLLEDAFSEHKKEEVDLSDAEVVTL